MFLLISRCSMAMLLSTSWALTSEPIGFSLAPLPYAVDALEPIIDKETMEIHYGKHHQAYVDNLNKAITTDPTLVGLSLEVILKTTASRSAVVRNNAGGHYNHALFWTLMAPVGTGGAPSTALLAQIDKDFTSLDVMKKQFSDAASKRFGSGWAWLVYSNGKLVVTSTPNQDNPLMNISEIQGVPVLALDVWEHAYYLKYQNRRGEYLSNWWQVVNWNQVNMLFDKATTKP